MNYISLYRKYRPNNFDKIIGQKEIKTALKNAIKNNTFSHAYLFSGPRGTGKTSIAKIFAKAINCLNLVEGNPCNTCEHCVEINRGSSVDIFEIDAASNNGVDEIREIKNNVQLLPTKMKYKVYIIDEVHMLTNSAFNALLKTLEEPPHHVIFILATTESHKVPATIISRCQKYNFKKISKVELESNIKKILENENVKFEIPAIQQIVLLSDGSARDSLSILEQVIMFSDGAITLENVNTIFATISKQKKLSLLKEIFEYQTNNVLLQAKEIYLSGADFELLTINMLDILKEIFEYQQTKNAVFLSILSEEEAQIFENKLVTKELLELIDLFTEMLVKMKMNKAQDMYFELILLKALAIFENNKKDFADLDLTLISDNKLADNQHSYIKNKSENININGINFDNKINAKPLGNIENSIEKDQHSNNISDKEDIKIKEEPKIHHDFVQPNIFSFDDEKDFEIGNNNVENNNIEIKIEGAFETSELSEQKNNESNEPINEHIIVKEEQQVTQIEALKKEHEEENTEESKQPENIDNLNKFKENVKINIDIYKFSNINYSMQQILNILVSAEKEQRERYEILFETLIKKKSKDIPLEKIISFYNVKFVAASDQGVIIVTNTKPEANWISHEMCDWEFRNKIFQKLDFDFVIIVLSETEWSDVKNDYAKLRQAKKLPMSSIIDVEEFYQDLLVKQIDNYEEHKEAIENGKEIFDNIKIIE
ncbi:DNA polymerase III subunit gamma/tau [Spiroplasma eriocheiris]|uniref:DNA polymerase III subunit gamma/tau n=1 Tax=Spiroplasma eriocheiris TaxID=315358 RepID=A0A0H3XH94_9MOLU|nr:DNA polymerase III subunit gamma/tau [Spiroplasma eriocheiris]AHF57147.1 DNA polymerase III gamma/tau subunits [Spiroplasma eriocheiris CCTCC M 207170]AKM53615.1 DNA polymerase III subunits gamma and tau [Spiroplasma eriocheiris]